MGLGVSVTERKCLVGLTRNSTTYIQECAYLMRPLTTDLDPLHKTPGTSTVVCPHAVWRQKEKKWEFLICPEFSSQPHKGMVFLLYMEELNVTSCKWAAQSTLHDCLTEASILNPHGPSQKDCWGSSLKRDALGSIPRALTQGPREAAVRETGAPGDWCFTATPFVPGWPLELKSKHRSRPVSGPSPPAQVSPKLCLWYTYILWSKKWGCGSPCCALTVPHGKGR